MDCKGTFIGLAICADITKDTHPYNLVSKGALIYLCSMLITSNGYDEDTKILRDYAIKHELVVAMAHFFWGYRWMEGYGEECYLEFEWRLDR